MFELGRGRQEMGIGRHEAAESGRPMTIGRNEFSNEKILLPDPQFHPRNFKHAEMNSLNNG
jgi:hypothetical protein